MRAILIIILFSVVLSFVGCSAVESTGEAVGGVGRSAGHAVAGVGEAVGDAGEAVGEGAGEAVGATGDAIKLGARRTESKGY